MTGLPADGSTVYAKVYTKLNGSYQDSTGAYLRTSSSYTAMKLAVITSPDPNLPLSGTTALFSFDLIPGTPEYWVDVGTTPYVGNIYAGSISSSPFGVTGLPLDGSNVYVTLYTKINGSYQDNFGAYLRTTTTYRSAAINITSPVPGSTLGGFAATFTWSNGGGAQSYWLDVGTAPRQGAIFGANVGTATSQQVTGLPMDGSTVYVTLYAFINGVWQPRPFTFKAATGQDPRAVMLSPAAGATLSGSSATFTWTTGSGVAAYWLDVGTAPGQGNIFGGNVGTVTSRLVTGLPANGSTINVNLYSSINGIWFRNSYTYTTGP